MLTKESRLLRVKHLFKGESGCSSSSSSSWMPPRACSPAMAAWIYSWSFALIFVKILLQLFIALSSLVLLEMYWLSSILGYIWDMFCVVLSILDLALIIRKSWSAISSSVQTLSSSCKVLYWVSRRIPASVLRSLDPREDLLSNRFFMEWLLCAPNSDVCLPSVRFGS